MRILLAGLVFMMALGCGLKPAEAQVSGDFSKVSKELVLEAEAAMQRGEIEDAQFQYERALLADPANIKALLGLGEAHEAQGRIGRALKYYRQTLELAPNNISAIKAQALAFLKRDLSLRAKRNLDQLQRLCATCAESADVKAALDSYLADQEKAQASASAAGVDTNGG